MKKSKLLLLFVVFFIMVTAASCSQKTLPASSPSDDNSNDIQVNASPSQYDTTPSEVPIKNSPSPSPKPSNEPCKNLLFDFENGMDIWAISTWESGNIGELGFTNVVISKKQKVSGTSSAEISCNLTGKLGASKTAQGALKYSFPAPTDLTGKTISAKVYVPEELLAEKFVASSLGFKLYIKTSDKYTWNDGGWADISNNLQAGWNDLTYSPSGVNENDTYEIGIQLSKGAESIDWSGKIYIDDISVS